MKLSVIIPYRVADDLLERAVASVRASVQNSAPVILERWQAEILPAHGEGSVSASRNTGLALAKGDYVAWVDADDEVTPTWFTTIVTALEAHPAADVLTFGAKLCRGENWRANCYRPTVMQVAPDQFLRDILRDVGTSTWLWNKVFRRELFKGLTFAGRTQEDFRLMPALLARAHQVLTIPELIYIYHRPQGSLSRHGDSAGSVEGLHLALAQTDTLPLALRPAWLEGLALRAADYLRHQGANPELRQCLRQNLGLVLRDRQQSFRTKLKCLLSAF